MVLGGFGRVNWRDRGTCLVHFQVQVHVHVLYRVNLRWEDYQKFYFTLLFNEPLLGFKRDLSIK